MNELSTIDSSEDTILCSPMTVGRRGGTVTLALRDEVELTGRQAAQLGEAIRSNAELGEVLLYHGLMAVMQDYETEQQEVQS